MEKKNNSESMNFILTHPIQKTKVTFYTMQEFVKWLDKEYQAWSWISNLKDISYDIEELQRRLSITLEEKENFSELASLPNAPDIISEFSKLFESFKDNYYNDCLILSNSNKGLFIQNKKKENPILGAYIHLYFLNYELNIEDSRAIEAIITGILFRKIGSKNFDIERNSLKSLHDEYSNLFEKELLSLIQKNLEAEDTILHVQQAKSSVNDDYLSLKKEMGINLANLSTQTTKQLENKTNEFKETIDTVTEDAKKRIDDFIKAYDEAMALRSPVDYWEVNKMQHFNDGKKYSSLLMKLSLLITPVILSIGYFLIGVDAKPHFGKTSMFFLITALGVWFLRVLVRLYLSHKHLETESGERVVMVKTYLALMSSGSLPESEREIILQALFRPTSTGLIKDDGMPPSALELLTKLMKGAK